MVTTRGRKHGAAVVSILSLAGALVFAPSLAHGQVQARPGNNQAYLYEMSEDAVLTNAQGHPLMPDPTGTSATGLIDAMTGSVAFPGSMPAFRNAVSALQGYASYPSPLCPSNALVTNPKSDTCTLTLTGYDSVSLDSSLQPAGGAVWGTLDIVIQLDNPVDSPEWPLVPGVFSGTITFGQAGVPIGSTTGTMAIGVSLPSSVAAGDSAAVQAFVTATCAAAPKACFPFTGKFRQPVDAGGARAHGKPRRGNAAFYVLDDGQLEPVRSDERAVGWPTVRFEVDF